MQPNSTLLAIRAFCSREILQASIIALLPFVLIAFCWRADFVGYDDPMHVFENPEVAQKPDFSLLKPREGSTYFPLTILSYQIDHALFAGWMPKYLGSWSPGVRL